MCSEKQRRSQTPFTGAPEEGVQSELHPPGRPAPRPRSTGAGTFSSPAAPTRPRLYLVRKVVSVYMNLHYCVIVIQSLLEVVSLQTRAVRLPAETVRLCAAERSHESADRRRVLAWFRRASLCSANRMTAESAAIFLNDPNAGQEAQHPTYYDLSWVYLPLH